MGDGLIGWWSQGTVKAPAHPDTQSESRLLILMLSRKDARSHVAMLGRFPMKMFALKESHSAQFRASAGCRGALGFYLNGKALRVNIILIPQSPSQVRAETDGF